MLRIGIHSDGNKIQTAVTAGVTTTYFTDGAGNVTKSTTSGVSLFYDYDAAGRLYEVDTATKTTFTYNADHQRILKQTNSGSTGFLYDGKKLIYETSGLGGSATELYSNDMEGEYGGLVSEYNGTDVLFHQYDAQANSAMQLDGYGTTTLTYAWQAFGVSAAGTFTNDLRLGWGGQSGYYYDWEIDLYMLGMGGGGGTGDGGMGRIYDPAMGRFRSQDPIRHGNMDEEQDVMGDQSKRGPDLSGEEAGFKMFSTRYNAIGRISIGNIYALLIFS